MYVCLFVCGSVLYLFTSGPQGSLEYVIHIDKLTLPVLIGTNNISSFLQHKPYSPRIKPTNQTVLGRVLVY